MRGLAARTLPLPHSVSNDGRMVITEPDPTVRAQELGSALCEAREAAGLTLKMAGDRIDVSPSKLSRLENGKGAVMAEEISALLAIYAITGTQRTKLLALAREAEKRGWWQRSAPNFAERQETLISLESRAITITNFEAVVIPGLLQTGEYTRSIMVESRLIDDSEVEGRMITRLKRHSVLLRSRPPGLVAIIDELALVRVIGGRDVQRRQLDHLVEMAQRPNIIIRVVPNANRAHAGLAGGFMVIRRREGRPVVFLGNHTSSLFLEDRAEIAQYEEVTRLLLMDALDPAQSVQYIAEQAALLETGEQEPHGDAPDGSDLDQEQL